MPRRKSDTPVESAGRALINWANEQALMRDIVRKRNVGGETVFYAPLPRMTVEKDRAN